MAWLLERITYGILLTLSISALTPVRAAEKLKVLIVDGQNNHSWQATTPFMKKALEDSGRFAVEVATAPARPRGAEEQAKYKEEMAKFQPEFAKYDVVLSNYNGDLWPETTRKALEAYVAGGKGGLVIIHAANNSFPGWVEYNEMIAMGWRDNKFGDRLILDADGKEKRVEKGQGAGAGHGRKHAFKVVVRDPKHPVTEGMPAEWMHAADELYHGMRGPAKNVHLLATAYSDKGTGGTGDHEPMIWTVTYGQGRVFHTPMGHDLDGMRCLGFVATLQRGTEWAATGKVTIPLPRDFPTAKDVRSVK
jgi:type 1 glutamine amidotransferase